MTHFLQTAFLWYLRQAAILQLLKNRPLIIGVTGSAGKTSAVKAIGLALQSNYRVKHTKKGNSETGLPLEILGIKIDNFSLVGWFKMCLLSLWKLLTYWPTYEVLVAEMGIDSPTEPKNMSYLLKIIKPQLGVFLSVTSVHAQNFKGANLLQSIANEKAKLLHSLPSNGLAVFSMDYPEIIEATKGVRAAQKTFSTGSRSADMVLADHQVTLDRTTFTLTYQGTTQTIVFNKICLFKETFGTFASALLIADHLGVPLTAAIESLEQHYTLEPGRMSLFKGINHTTLIDSSYNSSLVPTASALRLLHSLPSQGRKIAVLGDMRELGDNAQADHEALAEVIKKTTDMVFLVGPLTEKFTLPQLLKHGFDEKRVTTFTTAYDAVPAIKATIQPDDIILIKGSQNTIFLEIVVKALLANPSDAQYLCRQTPYWEKQRQKLLS